MSLDFIKKNWILLVLLLISFAITITGVFYKCNVITIIGAVLSLVISIFKAIRSYLTIRKITEKLIELDDRTTWHEV